MSEYHEDEIRAPEQKPAALYHDSCAIWNGVSASVVEIHQGLTRTTMKLTAGRATALKVRWPSEKTEGACPDIGEHVVACISAGQVVLATPDRWPGHDRWNRWVGRVVSIETGDQSVVLVKVQGEQWTLRSTCPVVGLTRSPQVSDLLNIVIDPHTINLIRDRISRQWSARRVTEPDVQSETIGMVRLKGRTRSVHRTSNGCLLSISIGEARISALLDESEENNPVWRPGMNVEIHMNEKDSWVKYDQGVLMPCNLAYLSPEWDRQF
jgi:hypothetical protein